MGVSRARTLVDCVNPVEVERFTLTTDGRESLAERVARLTGARVVKAFNLCHAAVWREIPPLDGRPLVVPMAADDPEAFAVVAGLVRVVGAEPLDAGGLEQAGHIEAMAAIVIACSSGGLRRRRCSTSSAATPSPTAELRKARKYHRGGSRRGAPTPAVRGQEPPVGPRHGWQARPPSWHVNE